MRIIHDIWLFFFLHELFSRRLVHKDPWQPPLLPAPSTPPPPAQKSGGRLLVAPLGAKSIGCLGTLLRAPIASMCNRK